MSKQSKSNYAKKQQWLANHKWKQDLPSDQPELVPDKAGKRGKNRVWGFEIEDKPWKSAK